MYKNSCGYFLGDLENTRIWRYIVEYIQITEYG